MLSQRTINYAIPPEDHFWKWSEGHDAIEWADGSTLALWPEVHTVLGYLGTESGIPPLGAVLLALAACRDEWIPTRMEMHGWIRRIHWVPENIDLPDEVADVWSSGLGTINQLPQDLRTSLPAKCHLVAALFEGGPHCLARRESELVLKDLSIFGMQNAGAQRPAMDAKARFQRDIRALKIGLARHDVASLESLLRTGLDNANLRQPELPEQPLEPGDPRDLLDRLLAAGGEGGAAAAVAKRTIAMMNFPGRFGTPRDLPVGGIADITNRGTIDRLLPGELAWDDLVLAARLVHNEALYFRREIPPMDVAVSHTVLLDRGLRLWGTARVFSLGVALGLRHHPALQGDDESFEVVAATGDAFEYLDLVNPTGVRSALETLIPSPDPGKFLTTWWDAAQITDEPSIPDLTFITAREHLEEDTPRRLLGEIAAWIHARNGRFRVIALTRGGGLEMQAWSPAGNRLLCRGELDLEDLLKPPAKNIPPPPPLRTPPNPLHEMLPIYAGERLPFLFPLTPQHSAFIVDKSGAGGGVGVTLDRRLMQWPKLGWGGEELHPHLPGRQQWLGRDDYGGVILIASGDGVGESVRVFRWEKNLLEEIEVVSSRHPFPRHAAVSGGVVLLAYSDKIEALSLETGLRVAEQNIQSLPLNPSLHFDGATIRVELSSRANSYIHEKWNHSDTWPRLFTPDKVSLEKGVLCVTAAEDCFTFNPISLSWPKAKRGVLHFTPFEETGFSPAPGVILKRAILSANMEIWLDPRSILHLRDPSQTATLPWSILLSTPASSIWNPSHALCAYETRLLPPTTESPNHESKRLLQLFLSAPAKP